MNIIQIQNYVGQIATSIPLVKSYYNQSVYECWNVNEVKYGSVVFVVKNIRNTNSTTVFDCVLYYGDRLTEDNDNRSAIQTDAVSVIQAITGAINQSDYLIEANYPVQCTMFEQQFTDMLAGAYANMSITTNNAEGECGFDYLDIPSYPIFEDGKSILDDYYTKEQIDGFNFAPKDYVRENFQPKGDYLTSIPSEYVTNSELESKGYATEQSISQQYQPKGDYVEGSEIESLASKDYVRENFQPKGDYLTSIPSEYVTNSELESKGYATEQSISQQYQPKGDYVEGSEIVSLASKDYVRENFQPKGDYLTSIPSEYVTNSELEERLSDVIVDVDLSDYYTKTESDDKYQPKGNYLTSIPSEYITKEEIEDILDIQIPDIYPPNNEIWYTTTDGLVVQTPYTMNVISNTYDDGKGVIVCDGDIVEIPSQSFWNHRDAVANLKTVILPQSVKTLGDSAFSDCSNLESIVMSNVEVIGTYGLRGTGLKELFLPETITEIGTDSFQNCENLEVIHFPESIINANIKYNPFYSCENLREIDSIYASPDKRCLILNGVLKVFAPKDITHYVTPLNVIEIGHSSFNHNLNLKSVVVSEGVEIIGGWSFYDCYNLERISIPSTVTEIGNAAFFNDRSLRFIDLKVGDLPMLGGTSVFNNKTSIYFYVQWWMPDIFKEDSYWSGLRSHFIGVIFGDDKIMYGDNLRGINGMSLIGDEDLYLATPEYVDEQIAEKIGDINTILENIIG